MIGCEDGGKRIGLRVVSPDTAGSDSGSILSHAGAPLERGSGVIGTVNVVVLEDGVLVGTVGVA